MAIYEKNDTQRLNYVCIFPNKLLELFILVLLKIKYLI
jgi:hypothetical protein